MISVTGIISGPCASHVGHGRDTLFSLFLPLVAQEGGSAHPACTFMPPYSGLSCRAPIAGRVTSGLSDIEERFTCKACGKRGADVRPDFGTATRRI